MITLATTTISVLRESTRDDAWPDSEPTWAAIATGVRASFSFPNGREVSPERSETDLFCACDPTDVTHEDRVLDETTGELFEVKWLKVRTGLGLDHVTMGVTKHILEVSAAS